MDSEHDPKELLRKWRAASKLTQEDAAKRAGCSSDMLGMVERGERMPGRRLANQFKAIADIPTEAWDELEDDDQSAPPPVASGSREARR